MIVATACGVGSLRTFGGWRLTPRSLVAAHRMELADQLLKVGPCGCDVVELRMQRFKALLQLATFGFGKRVGRPYFLEAALQGAHLLLASLPARNLLRRDSVRHSLPDLLHSRREQLGLARDQLEVAFERAGLEPGVDAGLLQRHQSPRALRHLFLFAGCLALRILEPCLRSLGRLS